jgi:endonuclease-3 related protein
MEIYAALHTHYGPQNWWPADSVFEMLVGAVLTQNTNWQNVKKALANLQDRGLLSFAALHELPQPELAEYIRPSGYYNLKAGRLKNLLQMLADSYGGSLEDLLQEETMVARQSLLEVKGIGPETADSILLYGGNHPIFVVDAYTHRVFSRHGLLPEECDYQEAQELFMDNLEPDYRLFNEYHALIVQVAKDFCKKSKPLCDVCPLEGL